MNTVTSPARVLLLALMLAPATVLIALSAGPVPQPGMAPALPPESPRWELEANARPAESPGRTCRLLNGRCAVCTLAAHSVRGKPLG